MKKQILSFVLLLLACMAGNLTAAAQTPEPSGQWKFDDPSDLLAATVGNVTLSPVVLGSSSVSSATLSEAGITAAEGANGSAGIFVPAASGLKVTRAEGASASSNFSFMIDLKVLNAYAYDGLFQTNMNNSNDGDLFISKSQIGLGGYLGGYYGCIWNDSWYRIIMTNSNGSVKVYVNGEKVIDYATTDGRFEIDPAFYLHADEDGEVSDTYFSEIAFWETPLTDEEAVALGSLDNTPWITDASAIKDGDEFYIISDRAKFNGTKSGKPKAMSTYQSNYTTSNWGEQYVYWGDLNKESDAYVWTAEKVGDQWAFLNKENGKYIGNMNEGESDVIFSDTPVGYTLTDLAEGAGRFYMTNEESEHSLHVQGYLRSDRESNSLSKQNVGDDDYQDADVTRNGYPGRWRFVKIGSDEPVETGMRIETLDDFLAFAEAVSNGETTLEAYLAADIELTDNTMVGTYAGTFDGKGHKITYNYTNVDSHCGLFKTLSDGAVIRNLYVEGSAVVQGIHYGALAGDYSGTVLVENVVTNVNITGDRSGVTGDGGMAGYVDGNVTFNNCATLGKMGNSGTSMYCGFVAFATDASVSTLNNCYTTCELTEGTGDSYCYTFCRGTVQLNNCYYLNAVGTIQGTAITEDKFATGEFCYMLNGDQSTIGWYQTLGEDALPVPFDSHLRVYANGELKCDGTSAGGDELVYSNSSTSVIPPHTFEGGWCSVCGTWDASYQLEVDAEGFSLINNAGELAWFAEYLAQGKPSLNVRLTADIDLTTDYPDLMIASESNRFSGIFDGGFHTITYNYMNVTDKWRGLFRSVENATIRNLYVEGSATPTNIHFGALIGVAYGTVLVENVVTNVNITGKSNTDVQGDGGMLGANYANITFNNCATLGEMGNKDTSMYSSFSGWSNGSSNTTLNNCFSMCQLTSGTGTGNCFTLTHTGGPVTINNSYYLYTVGSAQGTAVTTEQIAGGWLCYTLNGDQSAIVWTQTIEGTGIEPYPTPDPNGQRVYVSGTARCDGAELEDNPFTYTNTETYPFVPDHQFNDEGICTVCGTTDLTAVPQDENGYYLIGNAKQLNWFAASVKCGVVGIKARLTADIDLSADENKSYASLMIGTEANPMQGIFDGDGYTITYNYTNVADKWRGLFAFVKDATIRNLYVEGSAYVTNIHFGALIGHAEGTVLVENVITNVDITGARSSVTGDGGMLGANYADITFNNCATLGTMGYAGSSMYSSFSAWSNGTSATTLNNCYSLCSLTEGTGTSNCFTLTHRSGTITINNSYYLNLIGTYVGGTEVTAEQVANGELCALLGNGWYQNIGEDAYPIFDKTHNTVKMITDAGYATMYIPDAVEAPADVEVFTGSIEKEGWLTLNAVNGAVPAWEPVILKGAAGIYSFTPAAATENIAGNVLKGAAEDIVAAGKYVLAKPEGEPVGFYMAATGTIKAGKAYLEIPSEVKAFYFDGEDATGISVPTVSSVNSEDIYNLAGQRLQKMQKGINIIGGRKVLVK